MGGIVPSGGKAGPAPDLHVYLQEFPFLVFTSSLKAGKQLKTSLCSSPDHGPCVIKVYRKPPPGALGTLDVDAELRLIADRLALMRDHLSLVEVRRGSGAGRSVSMRACLSARCVFVPDSLGI